MSKKLKCLTVCQPWAELIASGQKLVENRVWKTNHRGALLIHAGLKGRSVDRLRHLDFGKIVACVNLVDCVHIDSLPHTQPELATHEYTEGPWCWILGNVRRVEPISFAGSLGLFSVPADVVERLVYCDEVKA